MDFFIFISEQWVLVSFLMVFVYLFAWTEKNKAGAAVGLHELTRMVNADEAVVLDIRDSKDFAEGHIVNAINIPFNKVAGRVSELNKYKDSTIILVDKMGQHTGSVGKQLSREGYTVKRLRGGVAEWSAQNLPLVRT